MSRAPGVRPSFGARIQARSRDGWALVRLGAGFLVAFGVSGVLAEWILVRRLHWYTSDGGAFGVGVAFVWVCMFTAGLYVSTARSRQVSWAYAVLTVAVGFVALEFIAHSLGW